MAQITKKKKRLLIGYESLAGSEIVLILHEIISRLKSVFKNHIGKENSISASELFEEIYNVAPEKVQVYKREYWWNVLKRVIRQLRSNQECYIINMRGDLYVLKTIEEYNEYAKMLDRDIAAIKESKRKAKEWVENEEYKKIGEIK
jgi:hypothetical protein